MKSKKYNSGNNNSNPTITVKNNSLNNKALIEKPKVSLTDPVLVTLKKQK